MAKANSAVLKTGVLIVGAWLAGAIVWAPSPMAFGGAPQKTADTALSGAGKVWIVRPDGAQSCNAKAGQATDEVREELKKAGISIFESRKGSDGKLHAQVCGAPAGSVNAFLIAESDLPKALALGFKTAPGGFGNK